MLKHTILLFVLTSFLAAPPAMAQAVNGTCPELGATTMAANQMELLACLKDSAGKLKWKSMNSSGSTGGSICGWYRVTSTHSSCHDSDCGAGWDETTYTPIDIQKCEGKTIASLTKDRWGQYTGGATTTCPSGYTARSLSFTSGNAAVRDYFCGKD